MEHLLHRTADESTYYSPPPQKSLLGTTTKSYSCRQLFSSLSRSIDFCPSVANLMKLPRHVASLLVCPKETAVLVCIMKTRRHVCAMTHSCARLTVASVYTLWCRAGFQVLRVSTPDCFVLCLRFIHVCVLAHACAYIYICTVYMCICTYCKYIHIESTCVCVHICVYAQRVYMCVCMYLRVCTRSLGVGIYVRICLQSLHGCV